MVLHDFRSRSRLFRSTSSDGRGFWHYKAGGAPNVVEIGYWDGIGSCSLKPHFHDEAQLTFVMSGSRAFRIGDVTVTVKAGQGISIPAGLVHTPLLTTDNETACINLYVSTASVAISFEVFDIQHAPVGADGIPLCHIGRATNISRLEPPSVPLAKTATRKISAALTDSHTRVGDIAASFDRSRAGFTRHVTRELGVPPHAFRLLSRLNRARQLLREGQSIAAVAAETGFSDQSHMTRMFRRTFGTTPGRYQDT